MELVAGRFVLAWDDTNGMESKEKLEESVASRAYAEDDRRDVCHP